MKVTKSTEEKPIKYLNWYARKYQFNRNESSNAGIEEPQGYKIFGKQIAKWKV